VADASLAGGVQRVSPPSADARRRDAQARTPAEAIASSAGDVQRRSPPSARQAADSQLLMTSPRHRNSMLRVPCVACNESVLFPGGLRMRECLNCTQVMVLHSEARARRQGPSAIETRSLQRQPSMRVLARISKGFFRFLDPRETLGAISLLKALPATCRRRAQQSRPLLVTAEDSSVSAQSDRWCQCNSCKAAVLVPFQAALECPRCTLAGCPARLQLFTPACGDAWDTVQDGGHRHPERPNT